MSLLLDALKRAEQEKQTRQSEKGAVRAAPGPGQKPSLELAPIASNEPAAAQRATASPPPAPTRPAGGTASRKALWIAGGIIAVVIAVAVAYVWYSIASLTPNPNAPRAPVARPITAAPPVASPPAPPVDKPQATAGVPGPVTTPKPPARASRPAEAARAAAPAPVAPLLQPSRPSERARIAPEVARGYAALRGGDLAAAKREYAAALAADASSLDATLGLATAEARGGQTEAARSLYRRALEIDPRNATALAGLAATADVSAGSRLEQELLRDIVQHPESAALHFLLGNLYASQSAWTQAQAAYFEAHRLDPGNPDTLHNLAVSLDRMGQTRAAATFYARALETARNQAAQFDDAAVGKRLAEIDRAK